MRKYPIILGFTGSFGSGCTEIIKLIEENLKSESKTYSLSTYLMKLINSSDWKQKLEEAKPEEKRHIKQLAGNFFRETQGNNILSKLVIEDIKKNINSNKFSGVKFISVDSIRNLGEIDELRKELKTYIWAVYANYETRVKRKQEDYQYKIYYFKKDDEKDHLEKKSYGQQVDACVDTADIMIENESDLIESALQRQKFYDDKISPVLELINNPKSRNPKRKEVYMAMAYAIAAQSRCLQRKVGAVITTKDFDIVSLGFNDVPKKIESCAEKFKECYRKKIKSELLNSYTHCPKCGGKLKEDKTCDNCSISIEDEYLKDRNLDICRSLHAEENAIVKAAKVGLPLRDGIIFTTTFPCNMCSNRIVDVGLKRVVYVEPYPSETAIKTLETNDIKLELFDGIKSRAFFDLYKRMGDIR